MYFCGNHYNGILMGDHCEVSFLALLFPFGFGGSLILYQASYALYEEFLDCFLSFPLVFLRALGTHFFQMLVIHVFPSPIFFQYGMFQIVKIYLLHCLGYIFIRYFLFLSFSPFIFIDLSILFKTTKILVY